MIWKRNHHNMKKKQSNEKETIMIWKRNNHDMKKKQSWYEKETILLYRNSYMRKKQLYEKDWTGIWFRDFTVIHIIVTSSFHSPITTASLQISISLHSPHPSEHTAIP